MTASTFDALGARHSRESGNRDLEAAGIERRQAEAIAEGMRRAAGADHAELATKADLAAGIAGLESRMYRAFWIQAAALIGTQLAIAGFVVHLLSQP